MIDTDQDRDYAEEAAVRAEQDAERASETAHERLVAETVRRLRDLARAAHADALVAVERLADEVGLRLAPNVHRYELLARQQHLALLASMVAAAIEETGSYDLESVARGVIAGYRATHGVPAEGDLQNRALGHAGARAFAVVAEVANFAVQAETDREVEQHERDLAERDA